MRACKDIQSHIEKLGDFTHMHGKCWPLQIVLKQRYAVVICEIGLVQAKSQQSGYPDNVKVTYKFSDDSEYKFG